MLGMHQCKGVGGFWSALLKCELAQMGPEGLGVAQVLRDGSGGSEMV